MGEKVCAQMRVNTKDCLDALQASFFFYFRKPLAATTKLQRHSGSSKTDSLLGPVLFIFASSVLNERNEGLALFYACVLDDSRTWLKCDVSSERSKRRHFDAFTRPRCFPTDLWVGLICR